MKLSFLDVFKRVFLIFWASFASSTLVDNPGPTYENFMTNLGRIQQIRKQVARVKREKGQINLKRQQLLLQIQRNHEELAASNTKFLTSKIQSARVYRQYYTNLFQYSSLTPQSTPVLHSPPPPNSISPNCPKFPLSGQALQISTMYSQLAGYMEFSTRARRLLQVQEEFTADSKVFREVFGDLVASTRGKANGIRGRIGVGVWAEGVRGKVQEMYWGCLGAEQSYKLFVDSEYKAYIDTTLSIIQKQLPLQQKKDTLQPPLKTSLQSLSQSLSKSFTLKQQTLQLRSSLSTKYTQLRILLSILKQKTTQLSLLLGEMARFVEIG